MKAKKRGPHQQLPPRLRLHLLTQQSTQQVHCKVTREQPSATSTSGATDTIKLRASGSKVLATATQTKATKHSASATKADATKSKATREQLSATSTSSVTETSISKASATATKALSNATMTATQMHEKANPAKSEKSHFNTSLALDNMEAQSVGMLRPASPTVLVPAKEVPTRTRRSHSHDHGHRHVS